MKPTSFIIIISAYCAGILGNENLIVSIKNGLLRGSYKESYNGRRFIAFEGIPFARPPIGDLRFEDPKPVESWSGVLEARDTYECLQLDMFHNIVGQEDCLYLNVYIPREKIDANEKLDVITHIHGSAFMVESSIIAGPNKLMDRDVIYVNFNYRLGPFGFYSLGDGRGNYGLKDQTAALKWIQDNIEEFGGNKDSVTLSGMSAGAASVQLHYVSDLSKGLFHKGFAHGGSALNPWAVKAKPAVNGKKIAALVGCIDQSPEEMYECMKQRSGRQIAKAILPFYHTSIIPLVPFGPVIEEDSPSAFLKKLPYANFINKEVIDVPFVMMMTTEEGTAPAAWTYGIVEEINNDWNKWAPLLLDYNQYDQEKQDEVSAKLRSFYFNDDPITVENYYTLIKMCTHRIFHLGGEKSARLHANAVQSNVYFILFQYTGDIVPETETAMTDFGFGAGHGTEMKYFYSGPYDNTPKLSKNEERVKEILLDMFVSYAKTGNPNTDAFDPQPVSNTEEFNYLHFRSPDNIRMELTLSLTPHEFWKSLGLDAMNEYPM